MKEFSKKVYDFFEGNMRMLGDRIFKLPRHQKEQVLYRASICKDTCMKKGKCEVCGCSVPGKLYSSRSCNKGKLFPDMMSAYEWAVYKKENKIRIS